MAAGVTAEMGAGVTVGVAAGVTVEMGAGEDPGAAPGPSSHRGAAPDPHTIAAMAIVAQKERNGNLQRIPVPSLRLNTDFPK